MLTNEQLEMRRSGITATDATVLAGVSPYGRTAHDVYLSKVQPAGDDAPTQAMSIGNRLEPIALAMLAEARGLEIRPGKTERHPIMSWVIASPDGDVMSDGARLAVAEAKAVGFRSAGAWGESESDEIPDFVRVQVQWQMTTTRTSRAHIVALIGTEARFYEVAHDDDLSSALLELSERFWTKHVLAKAPPPVDGSEGAARMVRGLFRKATAGIVVAPVEAHNIVAAFREAREQAANADRELEKAKASLCALIGAHEGLDGGAWVATWKERAGSPDWKGLAQKLGATPDLVKQYTREGTRVLLVKEKKAVAA